MHGWSTWMGWGEAGGVLWMLVFLVLIVFAAVALARTLLPPPREPGAPAPTPGEAHDVLRRRFASGEIDEAEFLARRSALARDEGTTSTHHPSPTLGGPR